MASAKIDEKLHNLVHKHSGSLQRLERTRWVGDEITEGLSTKHDACLGAYFNRRVTLSYMNFLNPENILERFIFEGRRVLWSSGRENTDRHPSVGAVTLVTRHSIWHLMGVYCVPHSVVNTYVKTQSLQQAIIPNSHVKKLRQRGESVCPPYTAGKRKISTLDSPFFPPWFFLA